MKNPRFKPKPLTAPCRLLWLHEHILKKIVSWFVVTCWERLTSWLSFVVSAVSLSLSHWYPGSGVVLDCIDSWSFHPYLLCYFVSKLNQNNALKGMLYCWNMWFLCYHIKLSSLFMIFHVIIKKILKKSQTCIFKVFIKRWCNHIASHCNNDVLSYEFIDR